MEALKVDLLVAGYIRSNYIMDMPHDIILLCLKWYKIEKDYWNKEEINKENVVIDEPGNIAKGKYYAAIVGSMIISRSIISKIWKLKFLDSKYKSFSIIGLISVHQNHIEDAEMKYGIDLYYGQARYTADGQEMPDPIFQEKDFDSGDILTIRYETVFLCDNGECHGKLFMTKNDGEMNSAFNNIPIQDGEEYRLCVNFGMFEETVELLQ